VSTKRAQIVEVASLNPNFMSAMPALSEHDQASSVILIMMTSGFSR
jgi:hypothetical protein